jgi:hypothetical protein
MIRPGLAAIVVVVSGCTTWSRLQEPRPVPARGPVQVWSGGQDIVLYEVRRLGDSLVGQGVHPDTTRQTVALSAIDSLRTQEFDPGKMLIIGTGVAMAVVFYVASNLGGS